MPLFRKYTSTSKYLYTSIRYFGVFSKFKKVIWIHNMSLHLHFTVIHMEYINFTYMYTYIGTHTLWHTHTCTHTRTRVHKHTHTHVRNARMHTHTHTHRAWYPNLHVNMLLRSYSLSDFKVICSPTRQNILVIAASGIKSTEDKKKVRNPHSFPSPLLPAPYSHVMYPNSLKGRCSGSISKETDELINCQTYKT